MAFHRQVRIEHDGMSAEVDEGLASLILALWQRGFKTVGSCGAEPGTTVEDTHASPVILGPMAWIAFEAEGEAQEFARIAGGIILPPNDEEAEDAQQRHDPVLGSVGVGFPSSAISRVLAAVEAS